MISRSSMQAWWGHVNSCQSGDGGGGDGGGDGGAGGAGGGGSGGGGGGGDKTHAYTIMPAGCTSSSARYIPLEGAEHGVCPELQAWWSVYWPSLPSLAACFVASGMALLAACLQSLHMLQVHRPFGLLTTLAALAIAGSTFAVRQAEPEPMLLKPHEIGPHTPFAFFAQAQV